MALRRQSDQIKTYFPLNALYLHGVQEVGEPERTALFDLQDDCGILRGMFVG